MAQGLSDKRPEHHHQSQQQQQNCRQRFQVRSFSLFFCFSQTCFLLCPFGFKCFADTQDARIRQMDWQSIQISSDFSIVLPNRFR